MRDFQLLHIDYPTHNQSSMFSCKLQLWKWYQLFDKIRELSFPIGHFVDAHFIFLCFGGKAY